MEENDTNIPKSSNNVTAEDLGVDGILVVSTPQDLVKMIVKKSITMANMLNVNVLGLVENMSYFICPNCNAQVPENSKFCLECGSKIEMLEENEMICPACGKKTNKGKFCMECGASLIAKCAKCGAEFPSGAKFCLECGEKL